MHRWVTAEPIGADDAPAQGAKKRPKPAKQAGARAPELTSEPVDPVRCASARGLPAYKTMSELLYNHLGDSTFPSKLALLPAHQRDYPTDHYLNVWLRNMLRLHELPPRPDLLEELPPFDPDGRILPWLQTVASQVGNGAFVFWHCTSVPGQHAGDPLGNLDHRCSQCTSRSTHYGSRRGIRFDIWVGHTTDGAPTYTVPRVPARRRFR